MTKMRILTEQCATCIFRPGNLMNLREGRVREMVNEVRTQDSYIPCHETMEYDDSDEDGYAHGVTDDSPVCRGFYDRYPGVGQMIRISERLNMVEFVAPPSAAHSRRPLHRQSTSGSRRPAGPGR
jgi:hypothetical protein